MNDPFRPVLFSSEEISRAEAPGLSAGLEAIRYGQLGAHQPGLQQVKQMVVSGQQ
jgi:hypothetical protein